MDCLFAASANCIDLPAQKPKGATVQRVIDDEMLRFTLSRGIETNAGAGSCEPCPTRAGVEPDRKLLAARILEVPD